MESEEAEALSQTLISLHETIASKLRTGYNRRRELAQAFARGENPCNYRLDWLRASSARVFSLLIEEARIFNAEHADERVSVQDMIDLLQMAQERLRDQ